MATRNARVSPSSLPALVGTGYCRSLNDSNRVFFFFFLGGGGVFIFIAYNYTGATKVILLATIPTPIVDWGSLGHRQQTFKAEAPLPCRIVSS